MMCCERIDRIAGIVEEIEIAGDPAVIGVELVIGLGIIGIIVRAVDLPDQIGAGIGQVPIADLAFDGERGLKEAVVAPVGEEMLDREVADAGVEAEDAPALLVLADQAGRGGPIVVEVDAERGPAADHVDVVEILLDQIRIVDDDSAGLRAGRRGFRRHCR